MHVRVTAVWLTTLLIVAGCDAADDPAIEADRSSNVHQSADGALADTLSELIAEAYTFDRPGAVERMNALYPSDGRVVSASAGHMTTTVDSLRAGIASFWEQAGRNMRDARWQWGAVEVDRLGPDAAVLTGMWTIPHIAPAGNEHIIRGAWTAVFRRLDGEWKIVQEHLSVPAG